METNEIIENNKLIALFMGAISYRRDKNYYFIPSHGVCRHDTIELGRGKTIKYHCSYDWLMPVVEKIKQQNRHGNNYYLSLMGTTLEMAAANGIMPTYKAVIEFIKWYNDNK